MAQAGGGMALANGTEAYTIHVNGSGVASVTPDVADIQFGVESVSADAAEAIADNTTKMNAILEAVKALDIEDKDVQTVNYNMWVEQIYNHETGEPTDQMRYHVSNQVSVRLRDITLSGKILESALQAGANNVNGITFSVDDTTALESEARTQAIEQARAKAEELAAGLGVRLGNVRQVSEYTNNAYPIVAQSMMMDARGTGEISVASGSYDVTVEVQVVFDIIQ
jgi:uncharacterized protein YggE